MCGVASIAIGRQLTRQQNTIKNQNVSRSSFCCFHCIYFFDSLCSIFFFLFFSLSQAKAIAEILKNHDRGGQVYRFRSPTMTFTLIIHELFCVYNRRVSFT